MKNYQDIEDLSFQTIKTGNEHLDNFLSTDGGFQSANLIFLSGTSGAGKTTFCKKLQTLISEHISVFYSREMLSQLVKKQTKRMPLNHRNAFIADGTDYPHFNQFMEMVESRNDIKILILDSVQRIASDFQKEGLSEEKSMRLVFDRLVEWKDKNNALVILIGQVRKDGDFQGANFLKHDADTHIHMVYDKNNNTRTIETTKVRLGKTSKLYYEFVDTEETMEFFTEEEYESKGIEFSFDNAINTMIKSYINTLDKKSDERKVFIKEIQKVCNRLFDEYERGLMSADVYYAEIIRNMHKLISE